MEVGAILKPEVLKAFESVPDLYLILSPDLMIQTASDAYLEATFTSRENIKGKYLFDVFPDNPEVPDANGVANLHHSLLKVLKDRKAHQMAVQRYDVPKPIQLDRGFEEKYWKPLNMPVLNNKGEVAYIIHKVADVTEQVKNQHQIKELETQAEVLLSRERTAHKEAKEARSRLYNLFMQAPAVINVLRGPELIFELANPPYCQAVGKDREIIGKPLTEAFPEIEPGLLEIHQKVYATGECFIGKEFPVTLDWDYTGKPYEKYYSFIYEPLRNDEGKIDGIMTFGYEVTDQVLARKQTEKFLEQQQAEKQRLESILNLMPSPLLLIDPKTGAVTFANQAADNLAGGNFPKGKPSHEYHTIYDCYDTKGKRIPNEQMPGAKVVRGEKIENFQMDWDTPSGRLSLIVNSEFLPATETQPEAVVVAFQDVTKIKQAERAMKESEERFRATFNQAAVPMSLTGLDGEWILLNEAYQKSFGYSAEELRELSFVQLTHPDDRTADKELVSKLIKGGIQVFHKEKRFIHKNGSIVYGIVHATVVKNKAGEPQYMVAVIEDITQRKKAEEEQLRLVSIVEKSSDFIGYASVEGEAIYINQAGQEMVGLEGTEEVRKVHISDFFSPEDKRYSDETIMPQVIENGRWEGEFRFRHFKTGELVPVHYNIFSIKDQKTGEIKAFATVTSNITKEKQKQKELERKNKELLRTNNDLDNFIYTASHDLKAPVINLEGLVQLLFHKIELNDELSKLQSMIGISFERFKNTIRDLTEVAKVNKEETEDTGIVIFDEILEETKQTIKDQIEKSGAIIEGDFEVPSIPFSRKNLRSIIYNLVSNGVKYCSEKRPPVIKVSTLQTADNYILLSVSDNGLGINSQSKEKIFGMFKRLHNHVEGSGVGLHIVKRIVDNAGGKIEVESEVGEGSTFKVYFR